MVFSKLKKIILSISIVLVASTSSFAAISTDAKLQYNKAIDYYNLGQFEEAATCFKQAIELDPNYIDAYYNLGSILEYLQQDEAALAVFKQIIVRKPDDYEAVYKAAALSKKVGEPDKAKMYLALIPTNTLIGSKAKRLAETLETDMPTIKEEVVGPKTFITANPQVNSDGVYDNITSPTGIAADNNGNLFVAGYSDNTIYKISPDNKKLVYIKDPRIDGPIGLAIDDDENIYIANYNKNNVLKVDANGQLSIFLDDVKSPYCMYIIEGLLFVSSQGSNSVVRHKIVK